MAGGAPRHWNAAVWVKESVDDGAQHAGPVRQGKGLLLMHVWAARHAGHAQHGRHGSHGMGQQSEVGWQVELGCRTCTSSRRTHGEVVLHHRETHPATATPRSEAFQCTRVHGSGRACGLKLGGGSELKLFSVNKYRYNPSTNPPLIRTNAIAWPP